MDGRATKAGVEHDAGGVDATHEALARLATRFALEAAPDAAPDAVLRLAAREPTSLAPGGRLALTVADGWVIPSS